jgi:RNA polymerase sigma-70 factor (ECF subfamily)
MAEPPDVLAETFRAEWPRLVATAMRLLGDLQGAEDVVQDVLVTALDRWPLTGVPANPAAWLMTACRNRALNRLRDEGRARDRSVALAPLLGHEPSDKLAIPDDRLRLVFICCHPVLPRDSAGALTLRMVGGLSTVDIARAWHVPEATMAQRIVRAKRTLAQRQVPFEEPGGDELAQRLPAVLDVVYLIFNEGYLARAGEQLTRPPLAAEAHRLARLLTELLPAEPEVWALRALIAFHRSRDGTRMDSAGNLMTLEHQDRGRWDQILIDEGRSCLAKTGKGPLGIQARLAAHHATAPSYADTDWTGIIACYDELLDREPSAVLALHRAVAVAMAYGAAAALPLLDALVTDPALTRSHRVWSVRADLLQRLGRPDGAAEDYDRALALVDNDVERRYLAAAREHLKEHLCHTPNAPRPSSGRSRTSSPTSPTAPITRAGGPASCRSNASRTTTPPAQRTGRSCAAQAAVPSTATTRSPRTSHRTSSNSASPPAPPGQPGGSRSPRPAQAEPPSRSPSTCGRPGSCA